MRFCHLEKINCNDENGITISSSGNLSIGASGSVSLSGGSVSISAVSKLLVNKSKSSYISLENEIYGQSSVIYESGSDRESYSAFTDDEPTAGVAEAKRKLEQQLKHADFKERQLMEAMKGSEAKAVAPTDKSSIPLSGDALRDRDDIEIFDLKKVYKGEYVKVQAGDDEFILGKAYPQGLGSVFVPSDPSAAIDHVGTFENHLQTLGNAAMNSVNQIYYDVQILGDFFNYGIATLTCDQDAKLNVQSDISSINEEREKTNKYYRDRAAYKVAYDADNSIINLAMAVDGIGGLCSMPEKIASIGTGLNKGISYGIKIMNGAKLAIEGTKRLEISVEGIGAIVTSGVRALEAGLGINNMNGNDSSNGSGVNERGNNSFEKEISKMSPNDRVAAVKTKAKEICDEKGFIKDNKLSRINGRDVYRDSKTGSLYAVDSQHGRFEMLNAKGKHQGEVNFDFEQTKPADNSGGHNLKMK